MDAFRLQIDEIEEMCVHLELNFSGHSFFLYNILLVCRTSVFPSP